MGECEIELYAHDVHDEDGHPLGLDRAIVEVDSETCDGRSEVLQGPDQVRCRTERRLVPFGRLDDRRVVAGARCDDETARETPLAEGDLPEVDVPGLCLDRGSRECERIRGDAEVHREEVGRTGGIGQHSDARVGEMPAYSRNGTVTAGRDYAIMLIRIAKQMIQVPAESDEADGHFRSRDTECADILVKASIALAGLEVDK